MVEFFPLCLQRGNLLLHQGAGLSTQELEEVCLHHEPSAKDDIFHLEGSEWLIDTVVLATADVLLHWVLFASGHVEAAVSAEDVVAVPGVSGCLFFLIHELIVLVVVVPYVLIAIDQGLIQLGQ